MSSGKWNIDEFVGEGEIEFERSIVKDPNSFEIWIQYYRHMSSQKSIRHRIFVLERAVVQFPRSYKIWLEYLELGLEVCEGLSYKKHRDELQHMNGLFERSLQMLSKAPVIWIMYLQFLMEKQKHEVTKIRRKFNECLYNLPITQHGMIWPLYIQFADMVGGITGVKIYQKYVQYATPESLNGVTVKGDIDITISEIITKIIQFGSWKEAQKLFDKYVKNSFDQLPSYKSSLEIWNEYIDSIMQCILESNKDINSSDEGSEYFENLVEDAIGLFPDQMGKYYLKLAEYYTLISDDAKVRHFYNLGIKKCSTVSDFVDIFDAYIAFEENILNQLGEKLQNEEIQEIQEVHEEFDFRMYVFEQLLESRPFLLNDMMLRIDINNLDEWFKRIELFEEKESLENVIGTCVKALTSVNPLKAYSASNNSEFTLPKIWIKYSSIYSNLNDLQTAYIIYSKAVKSQFKSPDDLAELYISWAELLLNSEQESKAIDIIENALVPPNDGKTYLYKDSSTDIHLRLHKSIKLWSFYLDLLESLVEDKLQKSEIEKVCNAYYTMIEVKLATPLNIINFANFLEDWQFYERSLSVYELGIKLFKDSNIRFEIWNIYLSKAVSLKLDIERMRDLFDQCLYGSGIDGDYGCPPKLCKPVYLLYSKYEVDNGSILRSIKILKQGLKKISNGICSTKVKSERDQMISDKFEIYVIILHQIEELHDSNELRAMFEIALEDKELKLYNIIELTRKFISFETKSKEFNRVRELFKFVCKLSNPESINMKPLWEEWKNFELHNGNESTFKEILRYKRIVANEFAATSEIKDSINPMGFIKSTAPARNAKEEKSSEIVESNPDEIDIDMDM